MGVKTEDFDKLFNELCLSLRNDDRVRTSSAVSSIISYLNFCMMTNYKSVHVTPEGMKKMNQIAFMCALGDKVYYSSDLIIEYSKRIKDKYGNDIDPALFAMLIVDSLAHELFHCSQKEKQAKGIITYQNYLKFQRQVLRF